MTCSWALLERPSTTNATRISPRTRRERVRARGRGGYRFASFRIGGASKEAVIFSVKYLEKHDYVVVAPDPEAPKVRQACLSDKGREALDAYQQQTAQSRSARASDSANTRSRASRPSWNRSSGTATTAHHRSRPASCHRRTLGGRRRNRPRRSPIIRWCSTAAATPTALTRSNGARLETASGEQSRSRRRRRDASRRRAETLPSSSSITSMRGTPPVPIGEQRLVQAGVLGSRLRDLLLDNGTIADHPRRDLSRDLCPAFGNAIQGPLRYSISTGSPRLAKTESVAAASQLSADVITGRSEATGARSRQRPIVRRRKTSRGRSGQPRTKRFESDRVDVDRM